MKTYTLSRKSRKTFYIVLAILALWAVLGCGDECISRNADGVCLETVSDIGDAPGEVLKEIGDSFNTDGGVSPFSGDTGDAICKTTGLNCD